MKKLSECKEYFKDLYIDCLEENAFEKSKFESTEKARFEMFCETLKFIFGEQFLRVKPTWANEASNDFYSHLTA